MQAPITVTGQTATLDQERAKVVLACHQLAETGLVIGSSGNVSSRHGDLVAVTATGIVLGKARPEDVTIVDLDGQVVAGELVPTSELELHLGIYRAYDAGAVVHTHAPAAVAVSVVADELPVLHYTQLALGGALRVAPFHAFGTEALAEAVVQALRSRSAALMANHGAVNYASSLAKAVEDAELVEWCCRLQVSASMMGEPRPLTAAQQQEVVQAAVSRRYGERQRLADR